LGRGEDDSGGGKTRVTAAVQISKLTASQKAPAGGLPWQAVHNGERLAHDPVRLSVYVEAPKAAIIEIIAKHDTLRNLFDNGWLHLFQIEDGAVAARYRPGLSWEGEPMRTAA
jgi:uncharacterized protein YbcC (UPF0753/DUF2309 family)